MGTYSDYEQRQLDQQSGADLDRLQTRSQSNCTHTGVTHNGAPVLQWLPGYYRIADFLGRYTDQSGVSAQDAVDSFVRSHTCNLLTSYKDHIAWRDAGYPTRAEWLALQGTTEPGSRNPSSGRKNCGDEPRKLERPGRPCVSGGRS